MYKTIERDYCIESDRTTVYEVKWSDHKDDETGFPVPISIELIGWYCGEPYVDDGYQDGHIGDYKAILEPELLGEKEESSNG